MAPTSDLPTLPSGRLAAGLAGPSCEVWRRRGTAWRIWCALQAAKDRGEVRTAAELVDGLEVPRRTLFRNLAWLAECGLAVRQDGYWTAADNETPDQVVERLELVPNSEIKVRHVLERRCHQPRLRISGFCGWRNQSDDPDVRADIDERLLDARDDLRVAEDALRDQRLHIAALRERERQARRRRHRGG